MSGDVLPGPSDEAVKQRAALLRSMSLTRMLDYGMDHWDAVQLVESPAAEPWHEVAVGLADAQLARAQDARGRGNAVTAAACFRRATAALIFAQMAFNPDTDVKRALYGRLTAAYDDAAAVDQELSIERLAVPFGSSGCAAWLVQPVEARPRPVVVVVGGQSGWGPAYHRQAEALARRGLATVLLETPGQGETRLRGGLHLDGDVDRVFSTVLDVVEQRTGYAGPGGVWGNSFGGLLAARAAVHDDRFTACCVNGALVDPAPSTFRNAREQSQALLGLETDEEVATVFRTLWLDPSEDRMAAGLLVVHGGRDPLVTLEQQRRFLDLSTDATLRVWDDGEHTIYNHSAERTDVVSDWFGSHLAPRSGDA